MNTIKIDQFYDSVHYDESINIYYNDDYSFVNLTKTGRQNSQKSYRIKRVVTIKA